MSIVNDLQLTVLSHDHLIDLGFTRGQINWMLTKGDLIRLRRGWYSFNGTGTDIYRWRIQDLPDERLLSGAPLFELDDKNPISAKYYAQKQALITDSVALGGTVECLAAAYVHGIWQGPATELCLSISRGSRLPNLLGTQLGPWSTTNIVHRANRVLGPLAVASPLTALKDIVHYHDPDTALCCLESALNLRLIRLAVANELVTQSSKAKQRQALQYLITGPESCSETRVRLLFCQNGYHPKVQVRLPENQGFGDILIGDYALLECDSTAHHSSPEAVRRDRRRDNILAQHGIACIRVGWEDIWLNWASTSAMLLTRVAEEKILRRGRRAPRE